jgi:hypothetical protein
MPTHFPRPDQTVMVLFAYCWTNLSAAESFAERAQARKHRSGRRGAELRQGRNFQLSHRSFILLKEVDGKALMG